MDSKQVAENYKKVLRELGELQSSKVEEYGTARYEIKDIKESMMLAYNDIYRKFIRLRGQIFHKLMSGGEIKLSEIRETFRDLANYGGMGVQLIDDVERQELPVPIYLTPPKKVEPPLASFPVEQVALLGSHEMMLALHALGATEWHKDTVKTRAKVYGSEPLEQVAELNFNYQLIPGKELELIKYVSGDNWLNRRNDGGGMSHLGLHVENIEDATLKLFDSTKKNFKIAQDAVTLSHTNPNIKDTRRYRYRIFDTRKTFGFDLKFIQRHMIVPGTKSLVWTLDPSNKWMNIDL